MPTKPHLPIYCAQGDLSALYDLLEPDLAYIAPDGERRWKATRDRPRHTRLHMFLWHPEGGLPVVISGEKSNPTMPVTDPWGGWLQRRHPALGPALPDTPRLDIDWRDDPRRPGIDIDRPFFPDTQNLFSLDICVEGRDPGSLCGLSSLSWIGDYFASAGKPAPEATAKRWARFKRDLGKVAVKLPRGGNAGAGKPEVWAFPHAARLGGPFDRNPSLS